jgi:uncharacterized protein YceK
MRSVLLMLMVACSGCAEIATNIAIQGGIQVAGEQYLQANNKPITRCSLVNVAQGKKMCRISRTYRRIV